MKNSFKLKSILFVGIILQAFATLAQVPQGFNYQAALRNAEGEVAANTAASLRMTIHQTTFDGTIVYQETHNTTTSQFGLVNLIIGEGVPDQGTFDAVQWNAATSFFMQVEVDLGGGFVDIGSQQLMSVPFAMASKKATDVMLDELNDVSTAGATVGQTLKWNGTNWIPSPDNGTTYVAGTGISITGNTIANTGDASATNEIQSLTLNGTNLTLSNGGGSVTLPTGTTYTEGSGIDIVGNTISANDASATNEIQSLTLNGTNLSLSNGGGSVTLPTGTTYIEGSGIDIVGNTISANDASATNEIQSLTLNGTNLTLSNGGGSVTLPTGTTYTEGSGIDIVGNTISANDASATNEIQSLTLNGTNLTLSNGGGSVTLPTGTTYTAGSGISIVGNTLTNTGDTDASNDLTTSSSHSGDVTGLYNNLQIASNAVGSAEIANDAVGATEIASGAIGTTELSQMGATAGQILQWNGAAWTPETLASSSDGIWSSDATNAWRLNGNIGLGISSPATGLHMHDKSGIRLSKTFTGSSILDGFYVGHDSFSNGNVYFTNYENADLIFNTNLGERLRITGSGNIGLGTSQPVAPLHLANLNTSSDMFLKWSVLQTGHATTDGSQIGLNSSGQLVIEQKENLDIQLKRNGSTKVTVNSTGADVNGELTSDDVSTGNVTAVGADITSVNAFNATTENLYINSAAGTGDRPLYANAQGQVYASNVNAGTHYVSYPGAGFSFDDYDDIFYPDPYTNEIGRIEINGTFDNAYCHVQLPEGAVITSLTGGFTDVMTDAHLTVTLYRMNISTGASIAMASCQSTGSNGIVTNTDTTVDNTPISMANHTFVLMLEIGGDGNPDADQDMQLIGVSIGYTLPN